MGCVGGLPRRFLEQVLEAKQGFAVNAVLVPVVGIGLAGIRYPAREAQRFCAGQQRTPYPIRLRPAMQCLRSGSWFQPYAPSLVS